MEKKRKVEKWRGNSLNTVMYEKRKTRSIIIHFEAIPFEKGLFDHVLNLLKRPLLRGRGLVIFHIFFFKLISTTRKSFDTVFIGLITSEEMRKASCCSLARVNFLLYSAGN